MAIQTTDAAVISAEAWAPLAFGEGSRIGLLGDTRCGKTQAARELIDEYLRRSPGVVLVVDDKEARAQFVGQEFRDRAELQARKMDPAGRRVLVFRGEHFSIREGQVDPESIGDLQVALVAKGTPTLVVYDELDKAANGGQWRAGDGSAVRWGFIKGGSSRASVLWGTQETQAVPREAFNQSTMILCFRMLGAPLRLLRDRGYLEGGAGEVIPTLPGAEVAPSERGAFVALRRGQIWDGKIYRFKVSSVVAARTVGR